MQRLELNRRKCCSGSWMLPAIEVCCNRLDILAAASTRQSQNTACMNGGSCRFRSLTPTLIGVEGTALIDIDRWLRAIFLRQEVLVDETMTLVNNLKA